MYRTSRECQEEIKGPFREIVNVFFVIFYLSKNAFFKCHPSAGAENIQWLCFRAPFSERVALAENSLRGHSLRRRKTSPQPSLGQGPQDGQKAQR